MTRPTPALRLPFFERGDRYSGSVDQARMHMIDRQMRAFADSVGDGVVSGLSATEGDGFITIGEGSAFIDGVFTRMPVSSSLPMPNSDEGIYITREDTIGKYGLFSSSRRATSSNIFSTTPPSLSASISGGIAFLYLDWNAASAAVKYVHLLIDDVFVAVLDRNQSLFQTSILEGQTLRLKIQSFGYTDQAGSVSAETQLVRPYANNEPPPVAGFGAVENNASVTLIFNPAETGLVVSKLIQWVEIDGFGNERGETSSITIPADRTHFVVTGLQNGSRYKFSIRHVSIYGKLSTISNKYLSPTAAVPSGDVADISAIAARAESGGFYISISPILGDPGDSLNNLFVRIHKNGSLGFEFSSEDIAVPESGFLDVFSFRVLQGTSFVTKIIEDKSSYTIVLFRRIGADQTRGRFTKVFTNDSTPPVAVENLQGLATEGGEIKFLWSHQQPSDVSFYDIEINIRNITERRLNVVDPLQDAIYIGRRSPDKIANFSFTIAGVTLKIEAIENENFEPVLGFNALELDLVGKSFIDVIQFINSANIRVREKSSGIIYAIYQIVEARNAFSVFSADESIDQVVFSARNSPAVLLAPIFSSQLFAVSPILARLGNVNSDISDGTGGFFSAGGIIFQARNPNNPITQSSYVYTLGSELRNIRLKSRQASIRIDDGAVYSQAAYVIKVYAVDRSGNYSTSSNSTLYSPFVEDLPAPSEIDQISVIPTPSGMLVSWNGKSRLPAKRFSIFRSQIGPNGNPGQFAKISDVDNSSFEYTDIMVSEGVSYIYRVGYTNYWGKSSPAPSATENEGVIGVIGTFISRAEISGPTGLSASLVNDDLVCTWNTYTGKSDGFEIYISDPISGRFNKVGSTDRGSTTFVAKNVRIASGDYRFAIRSVISEASIVVAALDAQPDRSLLLYRIGDTSQLVDLRRFLKNLEDPVVESIDELISAHRHFRYADGTDARIDMGDKFVVNSFITTDRTVYKPMEPIESGIDASGGIVLVNGGVPIISYTVDFDGTVSFSQPLSVASAGADPKIQLVIFGTEEVDGDLSTERVGVLSAQQFSSGQFNKDMLPKISHDEQFLKMRPVSCLMESTDGFKWLATVNERRKIRYSTPDGPAEIDVDVADVNGDVPIGATPSSFAICRGLAKPIVYDMSIFNKNLVVQTSTGSRLYTDINNIIPDSYIDLRLMSPPDDCGIGYRTRFFDNMMVSVHFRGLDIARIEIDENGFTFVAPIASALGITEGVRAFRDIIKLPNGIFLATASNALWKITISPNGIVSKRQLNGLTQGAVTIWTSFILGNNVFAYTDDGLFRSDLEAEIFDANQGLPAGLKFVDQIYLSQSSILLIATHSIWFFNGVFARRVYESKYRIGRAAIHEGNLYICTENGLLSTGPDTILAASSTFVFRSVKLPTFSDGRFFIPLCIMSYDGKLFVGGEGGVIVAQNLNRWGTALDLFWDIAREEVKESPTVYIDREPVHIGVYFQFFPGGAGFPNFAADLEETTQVEGGSPECVFFDAPPSEDQDVRVARTYHAWVHPRGSWAHIDYMAPVAVKINGNRINDGSRAQRPYDDIVFLSSLNPTFGEEASSEIAMLSAFESFKNHASDMLVNTTDAETDEPLTYGVHRFSRSNMRILLRKIDRINRFIYDSPALSAIGIDGEFRVPYPKIKVDLLANVFKEGFGVRNATLTSLGITVKTFGADIVPGTVGVWDIEDLGYRLPPLFTRDPHPGALTPNYTPSPELDDNLVSPIESLAFTGEFTYFGAIPGPMRFFGRRIPSGQILKGPGEIIGESTNPGT